MPKLFFSLFILVFMGGGDSPLPFVIGEKITYNIDYHYGFSWPDAGQVTFSVDSGTYQGKPCFRFSGVGNSFSWYDWFYPVQDKYYSWADPKTLQPYCFQRIVNEGTHHYKQTAWFYPEKGEASIETIEGEHKTKKKIGIGAAATDPLAGIYRCRNIDWAQQKKGQTFILPLLLEDSVYQSTVRYEGEVSLKVNNQWVACYKIRPSLIEGSLFKGGTEMTVYLDKKKRIPIRVEAPIIVGKVVAKKLN